MVDEPQNANTQTEQPAPETSGDESPMATATVVSNARLKLMGGTAQRMRNIVGKQAQRTCELEASIENLLAENIILIKENAALRAAAKTPAA